MDQNRGRGRARGRARPQEGQGPRPGQQSQGGPGGSAGPGRGRGGPPPPRPGGPGAWGLPAGQPQQSAWGRPQQSPQQQPAAQPQAWGPPGLIQQQHQIRAPNPQGAPPIQAGRASHRGAGDAAGAPVGQHEVAVRGGGGDVAAGAAGISRGAARSGRRIEFQNLIRTRPEHVKAQKQGTSGRKIELQANYLTLKTTNQIFLLYQYRVDFKPEVDMTPLRQRYLRRAVSQLLTGFIFDGTVLYTLKKLNPDPLEITVEGEVEGERIVVIIKLVGDVMSTDYHYLQVFNLIMRKCIAALRLTMVQRNYFDPNARVSVPDYRMELWPGYFTSVRQHERQILMCVEITHKVMRTDTVLHILNSCMENNRNDFKGEFNRRIIGAIVMTPYNNRFYRVDDVDWDRSPLHTFQKSDGSNQSYKDYYRERYNCQIRTDKQPLLVSRAKKREIRAGAPEMIFLVPELCRLTGLTDADRENYHLMRALGEHTRIAPGPRIQKINEFSRRIKSCPEAVKELQQFDMQLSDTIVNIPGRILEPETILGGNRTTYKPDQYADWTRSLRSNPMIVANPIQTWVVIAPQRCKPGAVNFVKMVNQAASGMSWPLPQPRIFDIPDDRPQTYLQNLQQIIQQQNPSLVMCVVSNNKLDRYSAIKKKCTVEHAVPSQVILAKNLESKGAMSIATKVAIQLNCKVGGAPWGVHVPAKHIMIVGYDACHDPHDKSKSYGAMVASLDQATTRYFSAVSKHAHGEELSNDLALNMLKACSEFVKVNGQLPDRIIVYRDGVGEGQLNYVIEHELKNLMDRLQKDVYKEKPVKLAFIVVSKRINTRLFEKGRNPVPGTVVDDVITLPERYDFFIVSQCVRQGTVSPTSYNIIFDNTGLNSDQLQKLSYKLTHGYFNWSGTVRVPAPCQYAHKLAFLVSQALQRDPHPELRNVLYYL